MYEHIPNKGAISQSSTLWNPLQVNREDEMTKFKFQLKPDIREVGLA